MEALGTQCDNRGKIHYSDTVDNALYTLFRGACKILSHDKQKSHLLCKIISVYMTYILDMFFS